MFVDSNNIVNILSWLKESITADSYLYIQKMRKKMKHKENMKKKLSLIEATQGQKKIYVY